MASGERFAALQRKHRSGMWFTNQPWKQGDWTPREDPCSHSVLFGPLSYSIREQCGHSLKSALTHMWVHDMRDEPLMPSTGHFVRVIQEYAGLGGDVNHLRQEVEAQIARSNEAGYVGHGGWSFSLRFVQLDNNLAILGHIS